VEISSDILAVREEGLWKFSPTFWLSEKNFFGNFQGHFNCESKMSLEISSVILAVREKRRWKFPATFWLSEKNVGGNFQRHFCAFLDDEMNWFRKRDHSY